MYGHSKIFFYKNKFYIFDAIEFNERFRFEDITSDLAFILMDLEFHHYENLSKIILEEYIKLTKDKELLLLINFYKCYRAYVRGKILSFQTNNQDLTASQRKKIKTTAKKYFASAYNYAIQIFPKPIFLIMCGFTGSGKTHLSQLLNQKLGLNMIQSDVILKKSAGLSPKTRKYLKFEQGIFSQKSRDKNYLRMVKLAEKNLDLIIANDVAQPGVGFAHDTNQIKILFPSGEMKDLPLMSKEEASVVILDEVVKLKQKREIKKKVTP